MGAIRRTLFVALYIVVSNASLALAEEKTAPTLADETGWGTTIETARPWLSPDNDYLILLPFPPEYPLDVRQADNLRGSMEYAGFTGVSGTPPWPGSAMMIEAERAATSPATPGRKMARPKDMIRGGWGLTTFLSTFSDGILELREHFDEVRIKAHPSLHNSLSFFPLAIQVSREECGRFLKFFDAFRGPSKQPGATPAYRTFGLTPRPERLEGGGCGSFAVAALKQIGFMDGLLPLFWRKLSASPRLFGCLKNYPENSHPACAPVSRRKASFCTISCGPIGTMKRALGHQLI